LAITTLLKKRFNETEFLQALYRAQCPSYAERVYIIVLDEMNLSHPEQYFADLLSVLEQDESQRDLKLMSASANAAPKLLKDGRILKIPANVWFIGTANHDETTKDFADKTYDRAHVMELPHQYKKI
jgi:5-methylcytosine-specific restriction endonuclease McrBC GTP-binding regulatory subunit McrB